MATNSANMTRRAFLGGLAAAAGAPLVLGRAARGDDPKSEDRIGVGYIGCGRRGHAWVRHLGNYRQGRTLWVCDVDAKVRDKSQQYAARSHKGCQATGDFREVLADPNVDAVVIATPDHWHAAIAVRAARAGKDILCESPLSLTVHEARAMERIVRRYGRVFQCGTQYRSRGYYRLAARIVREGRLGQIKTAHVSGGGPSKQCFLGAKPVPDHLDWDMWLGPAPRAPYHPGRCSGTFGSYSGWRAWRDYSGGYMTATGAEYIDLAQWALGRDDTGPVEVVPAAGEGEKRTASRAVYADGVELINDRGPHKASLEITGSKGALAFGRGRRGIESYPETIVEQAFAEEDENARRNLDHAENFLDAIRTRQRCAADVGPAARSVSVAHLFNIVAWLGRAVRYDPATWSIVGDPVAARWLDRPRRAPWRL